MFPRLPSGPDGPAVGTHPDLPVLSLVVLAVVLAVAVHFELRERRIPNWLTFSGMFLGLGLAFLDGRAALTSAMIGLAVGFGFLFLFYVFGGVGGGDVKLMGASGALLGGNLAPVALVYTAFLGAILAVLLVIWRRDFWRRAAGFLRRAAFWRAKPETAVPPPEPVSIPYGIAIALGCLLAILLGGD